MINAQEWINAQESWRQVTERARPLDALIALMIAAVLLAMMMRSQDRAILGYPLAVLLGIFAARRALSAAHAAATHRQRIKGRYPALQVVETLSKASHSFRKYQAMPYR